MENAGVAPGGTAPAFSASAGRWLAAGSPRYAVDERESQRGVTELARALQRLARGS